MKYGIKHRRNQIIHNSDEVPCDLYINDEKVRDNITLKHAAKIIEEIERALKWQLIY